MTLDEMDRLCAEKIMGWDSVRTEIGIFLSAGGIRWKPTRNIAQAWEVLEKVDLTFNISKDKDHSKAPWIVWFDEFVDKFGINRDATADTAPLAIVKACLKAKGVEIE